MLLLWGSKGYQKVLGHTQTAIECGHCHNVTLGKLQKLDVSLPFTGFHSFLMVKLISFLVRFVITVKKFKNLILNSIEITNKR